MPYTLSMGLAALKSAFEAIPAPPVASLVMMPPRDGAQRQPSKEIFDDLSRQTDAFQRNAVEWRVKIIMLQESMEQGMAELLKDPDPGFLRQNYQSMFDNAAGLRERVKASVESTAESLKDLQDQKMRAPAAARPAVGMLIKRARDTAAIIDRTQERLVATFDRLADIMYAAAHRPTDVTLSRERHARKARLIHSVLPDGWHHYRSPDVIGLSASGPTDAVAREEALAVLEFIAKHRGATVPEADFVDSESAKV